MKHLDKFIELWKAKQYRLFIQLAESQNLDLHDLIHSMWDDIITTGVSVRQDINENPTIISIYVTDKYIDFEFFKDGNLVDGGIVVYYTNIIFKSGSLMPYYYMKEINAKISCISHLIKLLKREYNE